MIHEFGVEPELAATWGVLAEFRYFVAAFGLGTTRMVSRYPKDWRQMVWAIAAPTTELERKRLEVLLLRFSEAMVRRSGPYDSERGWLQNAVSEHRRAPFAGILARTGAGGAVLGVDQLESTEAWKCPAGMACNRVASRMAAALAPVLRNSRRVALIDPHFGPENARFRRPLQAMLRAMLVARPGTAPDEVLVLTSVKSTAEFFVAECQRQLPRVTPRGVQIRLRRLRERPGGERLHNRYVLTDIGGVAFGVGLDEGAPEESDDINILSEDQLALRQQQYIGSAMAFDAVESDVIIDGAG